MALLLAAPLTAQVVDTLGIIVSPSVTILGDTTFVDIDVTIGEAPCDSACVQRREEGDRLTQALAEYLENCDCVGGGGPATTVVKYGVPAIAVILGFLGLNKLGKIADAIRDHDHPEPETEDDDKDDDYGEGRE